ncbi:MAG: hypothetical protein BK997_03805 [Candidatus Micrarchaeum sp. ARMAN-1]|nr:MAG: hypothetical protein BK997_03805 [Candidatus Micrarchaeum sp. ARMAN-1]
MEAQTLKDCVITTETSILNRKYKYLSVKMKEHIVARYIELYINNSITKCVADAIQISKLFLGEGSKERSCLLADALNVCR